MTQEARLEVWTMRDGDRPFPDMSLRRFPVKLLGSIPRPSGVRGDARHFRVQDQPPLVMVYEFVYGEWDGYVVLDGTAAPLPHLRQIDGWKDAPEGERLDINLACSVLHKD